jgi:hypothetical protein
MGKQTKVIDIKDMTQLNLEKLYCFMLDIAEKLQVTDSNDLFLKLFSPHLIKFPLLLNKVRVDEDIRARDYRDDVIPILNNLNIIRCKGVNITDFPYASEFFGIEITVVNKSNFYKLLKKVETVYKSKRASEQQTKANLVKSQATITAESQQMPPPITKSEEKKYGKDYPRKDIIEFTNSETGSRSYTVLVNGHFVKIPYGKFLLLLYLAIALKRGKNKGWIKKEGVKKEEIIGYDVTQLYRLVSDLKDRIKPIEKNSEAEIIANKGESKYRLTTMPSRILVPHDDQSWLTKKYKQIKIEVIKKRKKRVLA